MFLFFFDRPYELQQTGGEYIMYKHQSLPIMVAKETA
jgi:hypothetical protein